MSVAWTGGAGGYLADPRQGTPQVSSLLFWQHDVGQTIPNNIWTPLAWNLVRAQRGVWSAYVPASTTIGAGSDTQVLPQATINVASTATFTSTGFIVIRISGTDRVVRYTGKNATQFTGCTFGVGTMATGQAVAQAQVAFGQPGGVGPCVAEAGFASNATGLRGVRFRFMDGFLNFVGGTTVIGAVATTPESFHVQSAEQPALLPEANRLTPLNGNIIEVLQTSGGNLDVVASGNLDTPRLVFITVSGWAA